MFFMATTMLIAICPIGEERLIGWSTSTTNIDLWYIKK